MGLISCRIFKYTVDGSHFLIEANLSLSKGVILHKSTRSVRNVYHIHITTKIMHHTPHMVKYIVILQYLYHRIVGRNDISDQNTVKRTANYEFIFYIKSGIFGPRYFARILNYIETTYCLFL